MALSLYKKKRNFSNTPEPNTGKSAGDGKFQFVVQRHEASRLHYDFRLQLGGTLKSWAVPKGPSLNPGDRRLAVLVEDHPVSYIHFEGIIPEGNYGAGRVMVWDKGEYYPVNEKGEKIDEKTALKNLKAGMIKFYLKGKKLKGEFVLVLLQKDGTGKNWLLIKHRDVYAIETEYNSEDEVPASFKKKAEKKSIPKKGAAKKSSLKKSIPKKTAPKKPAGTRKSK